MGSEFLFNKTKELNLPVGKYALFGSAPLGIRGIRECHDIDIIVTKDVWDIFKEDKSWEVKKLSSGQECLIKDCFEVFNHWWPGEWDIEKLIKEAEIIHGLSFVSLQEVLKWKKRTGREKDLNDIELVEDFLKEHGK